jgi:hypothetical protein
LVRRVLPGGLPALADRRSTDPRFYLVRPAGMAYR